MIYLSAGHHDKDPGAVSGKYIERNLTKQSRELIGFHLFQNQVIKDKDFENNSQYQSRIKPGNGSVVFDIHFNSGTPTATGTECYVNKADFSNKDSLSYKMSAEICKVTSTILGIKNRGVKSEASSQHPRIGILNLKAGISVLWEICFISSVLDMDKYTLYTEKLNKEIALILLKYDALK
jgi:N-acetylmuramoyl-L-alanine amidase